MRWIAEMDVVYEVMKWIAHTHTHTHNGKRKGRADDRAADTKAHQQKENEIEQKVTFLLLSFCFRFFLDS